MTPLSLRLTGFTGIADGLGINEINLNFEDQPFGLIAIVGPNGKGKTTIIDNMHPYRIMPSRTDKFSTHSFSYFDHLKASKSGKGGKLFVWRLPDGRTFKSELVFTVKSKKSDCYLFEQINTGWVPYRSHDGTIVSDGKTDSYDRAVESLLGSPELFFTSRFLAQGRKTLSTYGNGDIKLLLSEMLNIEYMKQLSKKAAEVCEILLRELEVRQAALVRMRQTQLELEHAETVLEKIPAQLSQLRNEKIELANACQQSQLQLQTLEQSLRDDEKNAVRVAALQGQLSVLANNRGRAHANHLEQDRIRKARMQALKDQINRCNVQLAIKGKVDDAVVRHPKIVAQIAQAEDSMKEISRKWEMATAKQLKLKEVEGKLANCTSQGASKRELLSNLTAQAELIQNVPCNGTSINAQCPLLDNARRAGTQAAREHGELKAIIVSFRSTKVEIEQVTLELHDLAQVKVMLELAKNQMSALRAELLDVTSLAAKADQIAAAQQSIVAATDHLVDQETEGVQAQSAFEEIAQSQIAEVARLEAELASLKSLDRSREIDLARRRADQLKQQLAEIEGKLEGEIRNQSRLTAEHHHLMRQLQQAPFLQQCVTTLSAEIAYWKQMVVGLGNNGLIALCIDDAGPALSGLVNKLLHCYGTQYTIEIQTQVTMANGSVKEGFEIVVHDSIAGADKKLEYMSGGQKVWINDCLCRGIALYLGQNAGDSCRTLFSDETDGALDPDRKRQFMQMKRMVLDISGCEREFFISHTPECVDFADSIIDLTEIAI